ncbi:MAG: hypothetical protein OHK0039_12070 [Bacteroidia bacterium]
MLKTLLKPAYRFAHDVLYRSGQLRTAWGARYEGQPILQGHISDEHLGDPRLDDQLCRDFAAAGITVSDYRIDAGAYAHYLKEARYPAGYYGGGVDPKQNFTEKTLEHYVSTQFMDLGPDSVFVDIAACSSPFHQIVRARYGVAQSYQQDLIFPPGRHGDRIGGYGHELDLPDGSVDAVTLHCSLEHFEGDTDTRFFQRLERLLRPGGRAIVLPFYIAHRYTIHIDPAYNLLKGHRPQLDPLAQLRYCDWYQFFSRHYDLAALQRRILSQAPGLRLYLYRVTNFREVYAGSYLRFVGVFERV